MDAEPAAGPNVELTHTAVQPSTLAHIQGHIAAGLNEFKLQELPTHVFYTSAQASYWQQVHEALRQRCLHHGLPFDQCHAPLMTLLNASINYWQNISSTLFTATFSTTSCATTMTTITACFTARASTSRYSTHLAGISYLRAYKTKAFLKRKKGWKSGRTIIAYHKVVHRRLLKAVAILLGELANDTWSESGAA